MDSDTYIVLYVVVQNIFASSNSVINVSPHDMEKQPFPLIIATLPLSSKQSSDISEVVGTMYWINERFPFKAK